MTKEHVETLRTAGANDPNATLTPSTVNAMQWAAGEIERLGKRPAPLVKALRNITTKKPLCTWDRDYVNEIQGKARAALAAWEGKE